MALYLGNEKIAGSGSAASITPEDIGAAPVEHTHDDRYYTETEVDTLLDGKSNTSHNHDYRYYTETEVDTLLDEKSNTSHNHDDRYTTPANVQSLIDNAGGAKIISGSYTGTGKFGSSNQNSLTFDFTPKFIIISAHQLANKLHYTYFAILPFEEGSIGTICTQSTEINVNVIKTTIDGNTIYWCNTTNTQFQLNASHVVYSYVAFG